MTAKSHEIRSGPTDAPLTADFWNALTPLMINHYLWENNGYKPKVEVRLFYTQHHLHVQFRTYEENPTITYHHLNDPVYLDSCVEFFLQPLPESDARYFNFETNAAGTLLLGIGAGRGGDRFTDIDPEKTFGIEAECGLRDQDGEAYWLLQYAIPFSFIQASFPEFKPEPGAQMRGNFFKCGENVPLPHFGCWNLVRSATPDFHRSVDFGQLVFK